MFWIVFAQIVLGGALVIVGVRYAAHYLLASAHKGHAERLARATGRPASQGGRQMAKGIAMMVAGGLLLATVNVTAERVLPERAAWE